jgi:hypothetical protein
MMMAAACAAPAAGGDGGMGDCKDAERCRELHLCKLVKRDELKLVRTLVTDAAFFCKKCGRAAREKKILCKPSPL